MSEYQKRRDQIQDYINGLDIEPEKVSGLYKESFVNWRGPSSNENQYYTDYIAELLFDKIGLLKSIDKTGRDNYHVKGHYGVTEKHTKREEEIFAKSLLGHKLEHLGRIIDYQMPLKEKQSDSFGKVDLISVSLKDSKAYLIELKMADKKETLLRAALEIETYYRILDRDKLSNSYLEKKLTDRYEDSDLANLYKSIGERDITKAVLFAVNKPFAEENQTYLPKEFRNENKGRYENLTRLINKLGIEIYFIDRTYPTTKMVL